MANDSARTMVSRRMMLAGAAALPVVACTTPEAVAPAPTAPPSPPQPAAVAVASAYPMIIDTATDTRPYLAALKAMGVRAIFRYYAQAAQPEVPQKQLTVAERDAILDAGLAIGSVYQYYSNVPANIHGTRGTQDGEIALARAASFAQPAGSAIYFGIDFDWSPGDTARREAILAYFQSVAALVKPAGYRVGVYGSGATCAAVLDSGQAELAWLVNSPGHTGASTFYNSNRWRLFQNGLDTKIAGGIQIDTNLINPSQTEFGQWTLAGGDIALPTATTQTIMSGRRFVAKKSAKLYSAADASSAVLANTRFGKGRSVRLFALRQEEMGQDGVRDGWAHIDVNETGQPNGWCRIDDLTADMNRRPDYYAPD